MTQPERAGSRAELADQLARARAAGAPVALVPTMGALHEGHADLMARAREELGPDGLLVVSIFVNPMQFGPHEDLDRYPRSLDADLALCGREGVDVVFTPEVADVYPEGEPQVTVDPGPLADVLEGRVRPGHFRGVLTVVAKLFALVGPNLAVFGEKDYQQLVLIRRMVTDLCLPVRVVGTPTRREADGLALSSRNAYLDADERQRAAALSRSLYAAESAASSGPEAALAAARSELGRVTGVDVDYLVLTDPELAPLPDRVADGTPARALVAARVGATRLIDNLPLVLGGETRGGR